MKYKSNILIAGVITAFLGLILIQFTWIYRAGKTQERQFEYTVVAALNKAVDILDGQEAVCTHVTNCFVEQGIVSCESKHVKQDVWVFIDSIIKAELSYSKICIDYEFEMSLAPHPHSSVSPLEADQKCFTVKTKMATVDGNNVWFHVSFPGRKVFLMGQMGLLFVISIVLIGVVIAAFIVIFRYYRQEKLMAGDTRNFINNLTHEFKTPIASIRLANSRIVKVTEDKVDTNAYTKIIAQENKKLEGHVNYLLDISRMQKGKMPINCEDFDLKELIQHQCDSFQLLIEDREGSLQVALEAENHKVHADCFHLSNAINNILDNAVKYSNGKPLIRVKTENRNGSMIISISDKGLGIAKADQKIIFQEFSRVNTGNLHNVKGFGLGLSYVLQVVKLHKGHLWIESKPGEGSVFFIKLPLAK